MAGNKTPGPKQRQKILVRGIVQGVGFRPFVHGLAGQYGLTGQVTNNPDGVEIEVEGLVSALATFIKALKDKAPPLSLITAIITQPMPLADDRAFIIAPSQSNTSTPATLIPPDMATCNACLAEFLDPTDRRYQYPFINCTDCGPRYTIIKALPYDRAVTTMDCFSMCPACRAEYDNPASRRFHAEPNACPTCGPELSLHDAKGSLQAKGNHAATTAATLLAEGRILAIKGVGGFHLAVDARNEEAVQRLRLRKGRAEKPLAVMAADLATARALCQLDPAEEQILTSAQRPILLARPRAANGLAPAVAPGLNLLGLMLPYTPLHHLLLQHGPPVLVLTSGNISNEPIATGNQEALTRLAGLADFFLLHNRDIYLRNDDSVVIRMADQLRFFRRGRGYAPAPVFVSQDGPTVLAVGAEIKNTICLLTDKHGVISQHIGDLENLAAFQAFNATIKHLTRIFKTEPELIVHDLHPGYLSTRWTLGQQHLPSLAVQHHHAHLAACLAENREEAPAIGIILDGTGYGSDGTIWGGEILIGDCRQARRYGHLDPMPLPGGEAAIREPWRIAAGYLFSTFDGALPDLPFLAEHAAAPILAMLKKDLNCPLTSSCGRLFDAVAAMAGGRQRISYEAQAAIEFSEIAANAKASPYPFDLETRNDHLILGIKTIIRAVAKDVLAGSKPDRISSRFHQTLIGLFTEAAKRARRATTINTVALSGGVFQNRVLLSGLINSLTATGFLVLTHSQTPVNDGCISLGQAVIGRNMLKQNEYTITHHS